MANDFEMDVHGFNAGAGALVGAGTYALVSGFANAAAELRHRSDEAADLGALEDCVEGWVGACRRLQTVADGLAEENARLRAKLETVSDVLTRLAAERSRSRNLGQQWLPAGA